MKGARRWAIAGLLCLCGAIGCAQMPARGLFARRIKPPVDETLAEENSDDTDEESSGDLFADAGQDRRRDTFASSAQPDAEAPPLDRHSPTSDSTGGLFDVSSRHSPIAGTAPVEAPLPNRRSLSPPGTFVASPDAREMTPITNSSAFDQGPVVLANHESLAHENSSEIELMAGQRLANTGTSAPSNPWNRFRGLTTNLDANVPAPSAPGQSRLNGNLQEDSPVGSPPVAQSITQPTPSAETITSSSGAANNAFNPTTSTANSPELWPRAPGNWNTAPNAPVASAPVPPNVQWVNAEQPSSNNFPSATVNPQSRSTTGNLPLNFGAPEGAPLTIAPFASSPELERLIMQTTVETAAMIPGDNDASRQLYLRKHVQLRLLHLIAGQIDRALQPIPGIDSADQEFWQQMLWGMANYFDAQGMPDSSERATQTITQLRAAAARLQEKARLELRNVAFCHKISGFGNYQRFKRDEFTPGQPVLLYAEVADFKSEPTPDGQFRTLMKSTLEVFEGGPTGRLVESLPLSPSEDRCRNQRRDYYHSYEFTIPQSCNPGPHTLRLRVEDQLGKKTAITTLNFTVQ